MKKKVFAVLLAVILAVTNIVPAMAAEHVSPDEIDAAMTVVTNAVDEMDDVFTASEAASISDIFSGAVDAFKSVGSLVSPINGGVTFLKLVGVIKDQNKEMLKSIMSQLQTIGEQLTDIDRKLDNITVQMSELKASQDFKDRTGNAIVLQTSWNAFESTHMEGGMDLYMSKYNSKMLDGMQNWCINPANRKVTGVDNAQVVLLYTPNDAGYDLVYTTENGIPAGISANTRYLVLDSGVLPGEMSWNVNTYRNSIKTAIVSKMKEKLADTGSGSFTAANFPAFAEGGTVADELLESLAEDAVNVLVYRATAAEINKSAEFSGETARLFSNYCTHLLRSGEGLDAMLKTMYLTHAFEYEIADDVTAFCNQMAVKTGVYGAFALNVMGMSDFITDEEKLAALDTYCRTLKAISDYKKNALTGKGNYCYLTNTNIYFGELTVHSSASVVTMHRGSVYGYRSTSGHEARTDIVFGKERSSVPETWLIDDDKVLLLELMLNANGEELNYKYMNTHLGEDAAEDYGVTVVSLAGEQNLPLNDTTPLYTTRLIGGYFTNGRTVRLNSLPDDAEGKYVSYRKKVVGSYVDNVTGKLSAEQVLSALAVYGESHITWIKDESAVLGGPGNNKTFTHSCSSAVIDVEFPSDDIIQHDYKQSVSYNCLIGAPARRLSGAVGEEDPLRSYLILLDEIQEEEQPAETPADLEPDPPENPSDDPKDKIFDGTEEDPAAEIPADPNVPNTGDAGALWLLLGGLALCGLLLTKRTSKRKE